MKKSNVLMKAAVVTIALACCGSVASAEGAKGVTELNGSVIAPYNVAINVIECSLTMPSAGTVHCSAKTTTMAGYKAETIVELQKLDGIWGTIKKWSDKGSMGASVSEDYAVAKGYSYRLKTTHKAYNSSGTLVESFERYSNIVK